MINNSRKYQIVSEMLTLNEKISIPKILKKVSSKFNRKKVQVDLLKNRQQLKIYKDNIDRMTNQIRTAKGYGNNPEHAHPGITKRLRNTKIARRKLNKETNKLKGSAPKLK